MVFVFDRIQGHCYLCANWIRIYDLLSLEVVICSTV